MAVLISSSASPRAPLFMAAPSIPQTLGDILHFQGRRLENQLLGLLHPNVGNVLHSGVHYVDQAGLELTEICLPLLPNC